MPNNNQTAVPGAKQALDKFKFEVANELGIALNQGDNGNLTSRDAGRIGGNMVRRLIQAAEGDLNKI